MMTFGFAMCNIVRSGGNEIRKYECIVASRESTPFTRAIRVPWILMMSNEERLCLGIDEVPRKLLHLFELDAL